MGVDGLTIVIACRVAKKDATVGNRRGPHHLGEHDVNDDLTPAAKLKKIGGPAQLPDLLGDRKEPSWTTSAFATPYPYPASHAPVLARRYDEPFSSLPSRWSLRPHRAFVHCQTVPVGDPCRNSPQADEPTRSGGAGWSDSTNPASVACHRAGAHNRLTRIPEQHSRSARRHSPPLASDPLDAPDGTTSGRPPPGQGRGSSCPRHRAAARPSLPVSTEPTASTI